MVMDLTEVIFRKYRPPEDNKGVNINHKLIKKRRKNSASSYFKPLKNGGKSPKGTRKYNKIKKHTKKSRFITPITYNNI